VKPRASDERRFASPRGLAYATPAYRPLLATQRLRFVATPLAVTCFAVLLAPMNARGLLQSRRLHR
jgi:hypothetical protein